MMPEHEHRGFKITFDITDEVWKCGDLALADASLKKLKTKIDAAGKKRRTVEVPALYLDERWRRRGPDVTVLKEVTITLLREGDRKCDIRIGKERKEIELREVYPLDQRAKLQAYVDAKAAEQKAEAIASRLQDALDPFTAEAVREAVVRAEEDKQ